MTQKRCLVQAMECRRMFAGTAFEARFNFQPRGEAPGGYVADVGASFGEQADLNFGWNRDNGPFMVDRRTDASKRFDTLALVGAKDGKKRGATEWEVAVPDGLYRVNITAGDAKYTNSRYAFDVEGVTILDRAPNRANRWRSGEGIVQVTDGRLTLTSGANAANNKVNSIEVRQVDPHVLATGEPEVANPFSLRSIVQNEVGVDDAIPMMQEIGTRNAKLWYPIRKWTDAPSEREFKRYAKYQEAGLSVTVTFHSRDVPTVRQARKFFERVAALKNATELIDFWQIGNEPNLEEYWAGTAKQFVDNQLAPAYGVLHPLGEPVIGGGVTYDVAYVRTLMDEGYADHVDYGGFHPYHYSGAEVVERAREAKAAFGGLPMVVSEWNVVWSEFDPAGHAREVAIAAEGLRDVAYTSFYYALEVTDTHVGTAGVFDRDHEPNGGFYDVVKGWAA